MKNMKKGKAIATLVVFAAILVLMIYYSSIVIMGTLNKTDDGIKLGLDLNGGVSITYQINGDASDEDIADTITKLQARIENDLGDDSSTTEASVYRVGDDRITVEIPGVSDANAILEELGTPGTLYFIAETDSEGNENYSYDSSVGEYVLNYTIDELEASDSIVCTGSDITSANATYEEDQSTGAKEPVVSLKLGDEGTERFSTATLKASLTGETIGIYYDGHFVSVPKVQSAITNGSAVITGSDSYEEAEKLASYIRIGGLNVDLEELQSEVVGASLGGEALSTSFKAAGIGLIIVMIFLIVMYLVPGAAAAIALALYTALMIAIINAFELTLTLPGIAGMILSIGMAVDANVIIFARIREEIAAGHAVDAAIETGFKKALSAIVDGNITTLIVAAVLGVLGSGTVKGFASTLAIGVILSMFTALVITKLLIKAIYALGCKSEKFYGKAKEVKTVDFIGKRKFFFAGSLAVIIVGFIFMGIYGSTTGKTLNYSLEFLGGTSTTVAFDKEYTLAEADSEIVPKIADAIGSSDIQTQVVDGSNQIIFKTKALSLDEREAFNQMLESDFGVAETDITSQSISSTISNEMRHDSIIAVIWACFFVLLYIWFRFKDIRFAGSAIIALVHDVLVVLALYAVARISVGSAFIACILTVIGYSVNDTIVIFDRIRENEKAKPSRDNAEALAKTANLSLCQTLSRSISTSLTTAIMVLMLLILGVSSIREFALPLLVGVICGTYSSICIATELWYVFKVKFHKKKK